MFMQASARLWRTNLVDWRAGFSTTMGPGMVYLESLRNHEREGVPSGAGTDTSKGFDLTKMHRLLAQLGDPQDAWQAVHISGTKGKGSTATMLASIASAAGLKTGCYTSPHVVSLHERILMDGKPITSEDLDQALVTVQPTAQGLSHASPELPPPSHFEVLTAAAFAHFAAAGTDLAVVEVGLGGARDATNAFRPAGLALSVVTPIGSDHLDALGGSVRSVAAAKAGVLKAGRPLVLAPQPLHEAHQEIKREAHRLGCPVIEVADEVELEFARGGEQHPAAPAIVRVLGSTVAAALGLQQGDCIEMKLGMEGVHQLSNAATAITAAAVLASEGILQGLTLEGLRLGLSRAQLPGRFQRCRLAEHRAGPVLIVDGAHTPEACAALAASLRRAFPEPSPVALVLAAAADKDASGMCAALGALRPVAVFPTEVEVAGSGARAMAPGSIMAAWQFNVPRPGRVMMQPSVVAAVERARMELGGVREGGGPGVILVTGSMHAAGAALRRLHLVPA
ncbi:FPG1 [Auxenochlorella protothecoides x Auxenochlorella symbiontica]